MYFLEQEDFDMAIRTDELDVLLDNNPTLLPRTVYKCIAEATSYLSGRHDTTAAFAATGDDRNPLLVSAIVDMVLYQLHSTINSRFIPDLRRDRYDQVTMMLKAIAKNDRSIDLPLKEIDGQATFHLFTSNPQTNFDGNIF